MPHPNFFILYVENPTHSASFYQELLGKAPVESSATFALFVLDSGLKLGLWSRHTVEPAPTAGAGGAELAMPVESPDTVTALHDTWSRAQITIAQPLTQMDFGYTFVALDPDGHRVRVFAPSEAA